MKHLLSTTDKELVSFFESIGEKPYRARQIYRWIYQTIPFAESFEMMTDLPSELRRKLSENFYISSLEIISKDTSRDGTVRYNFLSKRNQGRKVAFPAVFIPSPSGKRNTVCLSTQAGCPVGCLFCASGGDFGRNLTKGEIIESYLLIASDICSSKNAAGAIGAEDKNIRRKSGVLFMGSGEPFLNYENLILTVEDMISKTGLGSRDIVLSTVGIPDGAIKKLTGESRLGRNNNDVKGDGGSFRIRLAVSLHTADDRLRKELIPVKAMPTVDAILEDAFRYAFTTKTRLTIECVMIKGITDTEERIKCLADTVKKHINKSRCPDVVVNLIPFNDNARGKENGFLAPDGKSIVAVKNFLISRGIFTIIRLNRGEDISGACGQLEPGGFFTGKSS